MVAAGLALVRGVLDIGVEGQTPDLVRRQAGQQQADQQHRHAVAENRVDQLPFPHSTLVDDEALHRTAP